MATMYPAKFVHKPDLTPQMRVGEAGEERVFEILKRRLPDDWVVFHGVWKYFKKEHFHQNEDPYVNREADFVVFIPDKGMLIIEVKNAEARIGEDGRFYYGNSRDGKVAPHKQAHLTAKGLAVDIQGYLNKKIEYRTLVIMLKQEADFLVGNNVEFKDMYLFGSALQTENLRKKICNLFESEDKLSSYDIYKIVRYWWSSYQFNISPSACASIMEQAAAPVNMILPALERNESGIRIDGCAGSGKTWMACREIERLANKDKSKKFLFLCYNRLLCKWIQQCGEIKQILKAKDSNLEVMTIYSFIFRVLKETGIPHAQNQYTFSEFEKDAILCKIREQFKYDYVFIDEAQDFHSPDPKKEDDDFLWDVVDALWEHDMKLYIFCDNNQSLYQNKENDKVILPGVQVTLNQNLRNSLDIASFSNIFLGGDDNPEPLPLKCKEVVVKTGSDDEKTRAETVKNVLEDLNKEYKLSSDDVIILTPWGADNVKNSITQYLKNIPEFSESQFRNLSWSTIKSFKGMERNFVILTDVPKTGVLGFSEADLYVACTRAKYGLYIVPMKESEEDLLAAVATARETITAYTYSTD